MDSNAVGAKLCSIMRGSGDQKMDDIKLRLGTIKSISPLQLSVDGVSEELTGAEVVVNEMMIRASGSLSGNISGSVSGGVSISGASFTFGLSVGSRVVVAPVGNTRWAVLCKVVTL